MVEPDCVSFLQNPDPFVQHPSTGPFHTICSHTKFTIRLNSVTEEVTIRTYYYMSVGREGPRLSFCGNLTSKGNIYV